MSKTSRRTRFREGALWPMPPHSPTSLHRTSSSRTRAPTASGSCPSSRHCGARASPSGSISRASRGARTTRAEIAEAIKECAALVLMCSAASLASRNVKQEIALGWEYERPYVPLLLEAGDDPGRREVLADRRPVDRGARQRRRQSWLPPVLAALAPLGIVPTSRGRRGNAAGGPRRRNSRCLREKLAATKEGKGGLVLIGGEAGIGKTTLAEARAARSGRARGSSCSKGTASTWPRRRPTARGSTSSPAIAAIARRSRRCPRPSPSAARSARCRARWRSSCRSQDFLAALAGAAARRRCCWTTCTGPTPPRLDLLRFLARSVATLPLLILVTYRSRRIDPPPSRSTRCCRSWRARRARSASTSVASTTTPCATLVRERVRPAAMPMPRGSSPTCRRAPRATRSSSANCCARSKRAGSLRREGDGWRLRRPRRDRRPRPAAAGDRRAASPASTTRASGCSRSRRSSGRRCRSLSGRRSARWTRTRCSDLAGAGARRRTARRRRRTGAGVRFAHALIREALYEGIPALRAAAPAPRGSARRSPPCRTPTRTRWRTTSQQARGPAGGRVADRGGERARRPHTRWPTAIERFEEALALLGRAGTTRCER